MVLSCQGISDVRRSLSFGSVPLEGADTVIGNGGTSCTTADQIPAEVQLQNECESMWKELNNVSLFRLVGNYESYILSPNMLNALVNETAL